MSQGARLDLGELIAEKLMKPKPATLLGIDFDIRRDFTPADVLAFHALTDETERARMVVGDAAEEIVAKLDPLPLEHKVKVWNQILRIAGVMPRMAGGNDDEPGESSASSQDSPTAGTPSPQTSAASTKSPSRRRSANGQPPK